MKKMRKAGAALMPCVYADTCATLPAPGVVHEQQVEQP